MYLPARCDWSSDVCSSDLAHTSGGEYFKGIARDKEGNPAFRCPKTIDGGTEFGDTIAKYNTKELQWECDVKFAPVSLEG
jgi:hypothetical protein